MSRPFFDSNIILYLLSGDAAKADRAESLLAVGGVLSVQVLNEVTSVCRRKLKMPWHEIHSLLQAIKAACEVVLLTVETHEKALELAERYQLSYYDALICAAALLAGLDCLLSEDMHDGFLMEGLMVSNPFKAP